MLTTQLQYLQWANAIYFDYCEQLTDEQLEFKLEGFGKSIHDILEHMLEVYWGWDRLISSTDQDLPEEMSVDQIINRLRTYDQQFIEVSQGEIDQEHTLQFSDDDKPVITTTANILFNFVTHNAYHRGQLAILLRVLGFDTITETDFNPYIYELGQQ